MIAVPVGDQDGRYPGATQFGVIVEDLLRPGTIRFARVDQNHMVRRVADEIYLRAPRVHRSKGGRVLFDVGAVDVGCDLHWRPLLIGGMSKTV